MIIISLKYIIIIMDDMHYYSYNNIQVYQQVAGVSRKKLCVCIYAMAHFSHNYNVSSFDLRISIYWSLFLSISLSETLFAIHAITDSRREGRREMTNNGPVVIADPLPIRIMYKNKLAMISK